MVPEILKYLEVSSGGRYIDCTLGEGGHTKSLLEASNPGGEVLGIDAVSYTHLTLPTTPYV